MISDELLEELGTLLGRCVNVIRELETENAELKVRREWVGLTEEEIVDSWAAVSTDYDDEINIVELGRAIEAALKEKNHDPR